MEGFFQKIGIYAHEGQKYEPEDAAQLSSYREDKSGQVLEEGINEAGAMSSWIAAATAYTNHDIEMIPIYIFYSMFGFQRIGDLAWAAADSQTRGFNWRYLWQNNACWRRSTTPRRSQSFVSFCNTQLCQL